MNFTQRTKAIPVLDSGTGSADRTSSIIDTQGVHGVAFAIHFGAIAAGGSHSVKLQGGHEADGSDMADLEGTSAGFAPVDANAVFVVEIGHSRFRYVRLVVDKDAANDSTESAVAYLHSPDRMPVTQPAETYAVVHHAPAAGVA